MNHCASIHGYHFRMAAYVHEELVRTEMGAYFMGCLYSRGAYYPDLVMADA